MRRLILYLVFCMVIPNITTLGVSVYSQTTNTQNRTDGEKRERERVEKKRYDEVCKLATIEAYDNFLSLYPNSKYAADIIDRKDDAITFNRAKKLNTEKAYDDYLNKSKLLIYAKQAKQAISELVAETEWDKIKGTLDINEIEAFIDKFPNSSSTQIAYQRKKLIQAINAYEKEDYSLALLLFNEVEGLLELFPKQKEMYERAEEELAFSKLTPNSSQIHYTNFLSKYPKGRYSNQVSNWRAINYAKSLGVTDSESKYAVVRSYARDDETRQIVEEYIARNEKYKSYKKLLQKKEQKEKEKAALKRLRELNDDWKLINFGIGLFDIKSNYLIPYIEGNSNPIYLALHHFSLPISVKLGSNRETLQFELGIKPSIVMYHIAGLSEAPFTEAIDTNVQYKFHMPAFTRVKLSIELRDPVNLYLSGFASYNKLVGK